MGSRRTKKTVPILLFLTVLLFSLGLFQQWVLPRAPRHSSPVSEPAKNAVSESSELSSSSAVSSKPEEREEVKEDEADSSGEEALLVDKSAWELVLVNSGHVLSEEYPVDLESVEGYQFDRRAAGALREMLEAARADGVELVIISTYRSFEKSEWNFNEKVQALLEEGYSQQEAEAEAGRWIARPGMSEHNTGLALDVVSSDYFDVYGRSLETAFEGYRGFQWLYEHCADYGFILRYPANAEDVTGIHYEPWHYRYVGIEHAKAIKERGITLEEYLDEG
ncbi:MAG: M15 family metallopeptidase [Provencibacterium sp.]|jgi:D-alanyl-D-alanine carboxypeptidase|nr:M15 family metallopeptidase [Provencibacterium sp.]